MITPLQISDRVESVEWRDGEYLHSALSTLHSVFTKTKSSCPRFLLGQERINSCGTTQIDANCVRSVHTSNNVCSPDNGRSPRLSYLAEAVRLALLKSIHTVLACRNHTICGSLGGSVSLLLVFVIGLRLLTWYGHSIFAKQGIVKYDLRKTIYSFAYKFLL